MVNPDFVPLVHEWVLALAGGGKHVRRRLQPGEPWVVDLDPAPPAAIESLRLKGPTGASEDLPVRRGETAQVRLDHTGTPGIYRLEIPGNPEGLAAVVPPDLRESDHTPLTAGDKASLASGWPLRFDMTPEDRLGREHTRTDEPDQDAARPHEFWRFLIVAALAALCLELWLTRSLSRARERG